MFKKYFNKIILFLFFIFAACEYNEAIQTIDCDGIINGNLSLDECGICNDPNSPLWNSSCKDCSGSINGNAIEIQCGNTTKCLCSEGGSYTNCDILMDFNNDSVAKEIDNEYIVQIRGNSTPIFNKCEELGFNTTNNLFSCIETITNDNSFNNEQPCNFDEDAIDNNEYQTCLHYNDQQSCLNMESCHWFNNNGDIMSPSGCLPITSDCLNESLTNYEDCINASCNSYNSNSIDCYAPSKSCIEGYCSDDTYSNKNECLCGINGIWGISNCITGSDTGEQWLENSSPTVSDCTDNDDNTVCCFVSNNNLGDCAYGNETYIKIIEWGTGNYENLYAMPCIADCNLQIGGPAYIDDCGLCAGYTAYSITGSEINILPSVDEDNDGVCDGTDSNNNGTCNEEIDNFCNGADNCIGIEDCLGICNGNATFDCANVCDGAATIDECGICGGNGISPGECDCNGNSLDPCNICGGNSLDSDILDDTTAGCGLQENSLAIKSNGDVWYNVNFDIGIQSIQWNLNSGISVNSASGGAISTAGYTFVGAGSSVIFVAGQSPINAGCGLLTNLSFTGTLSGITNIQFSNQDGNNIDLTGLLACIDDCPSNIVDCNGVCDGTATLDECGICEGSGIPDGDCDCNGNIEDECGVCGGDGISDGSCDCNGNVEDNCGICGGDGTTCTADACAMPNNTITYLETGEVLYNVNFDIAGFQFSIGQNATVGSCSGGDAQAAGLIVQNGPSTVLGIDFTGNFIPSGCGTLTNMTLSSGNYNDAVPLIDIVFSDPSGNQINITYNENP